MSQGPVMDFSRVTMILGAPRSGTSWIGKIFDSHPDVVYRHEPDLAILDNRLPYLIPLEQADTYAPIAAEYAARLARESTLKSAGQLPIFPKSYYPFPIRMMHSAMIHGLKWTEKVALRRELRTVRVPDLFRMENHPDLRIVIKSVTARGRAGALHRAMPGARFVFLLRHPGGQVASTLRGYRQGKFASLPFTKDLLLTPGAGRYGLTQESVERMPDAAQLAWHWATMNEVTLDSLAGHDNVRVVVYEDICEEPTSLMRDLFAFTSLGWHPQTEAFIRSSTAVTGDGRYYGVFQNPLASAYKWRSELTDEEQKTIADVVRQTSLAKYWPETAKVDERAAVA